MIGARLAIRAPLYRRFPLNTETASNFTDGLLSKGGKLLSGSERFAQLGMTSLKQVFENQLELGAAFAELATAQVQSLSDLNAPSELLQRQKEAGEAFSGKLQSYFEKLRGIAQDTQAAYVQTGKDVVADLKS